MKTVTFLALLLALASSALFAQNPLPVVYQPLVPATTQPGHKAFSLTVNGFGFVPGAVVRWNGSPRATTFVSPRRLRAAIRVADISQATTASVTVKNPLSKASASNVVYFSVRMMSAKVRMKLDSGVSTAGGVATGDFNNDGNNDLVVATGTPLTLKTFLGHGNGTFSSLLGGTSSLFPPIGALARDFNGDGKLDLAVVLDEDFPLTQGRVFLGNGDGTFTSSGGAGSFQGTAVGAGDFRGIGKLDLVYTSNNPLAGGTSAFTCPGNGGGTWGVCSLLNQSTAINGVPAIADFNGDGKLDLAFAGSSLTDEVISVYFGNGNGTFQAPVSSPSTIAASNLVTADLNGDGKLDLIADGSCVFLGKGDGTFTQGTCNALPVGFVVVESGVADINGDGKLDIITLGGFESVSPFRQLVTVALGNGDGTFQKPIQFKAGISATNFMGLGIADFNKDGKLDVAAHGQNRSFLFLQQ